MSEQLVHLLAGGLSGMTVDFLLYPMDTIKTRLQARKSLVAAIPKSGAFYRGLFSAMLISFPGAASFWMVYQSVRSSLAPEGVVGNRSPWLSPLAPMIASFCGDSFVCSIRNPFEVVKQQMQLGLHKTTLDAVRTIAAVDGVKGFYAGALPTLARDLPFGACQFLMYEALKRRLIEYRGRDLWLAENSVLGFVCGGTAAAITTPLDVAKTRLMTQTTTERSARYTGIAHTLTSLYKEGGFRCLFSGVQPRVMWISIGGAIFIGSFEEYRRILARTMQST